MVTAAVMVSLLLVLVVLVVGGGGCWVVVVLGCVGESCAEGARARSCACCRSLGLSGRVAALASTSFSSSLSAACIASCGGGGVRLCGGVGG